MTTMLKFSQIKLENTWWFFMPSKSVQPEKRLEVCILDWLETIEGVYAFKINNHAVYDMKRKTFRKNHSKHSPNGIHDIIGLYDGVFFSIEVKWAKNKPSADQMAFLERVLGCSGVSFWTNDFEDCKRQFIKNFGKPVYKDPALFDEEF